MRHVLPALIACALLAAPAAAQETWSLALGRAVQVGAEGIAGDTFLTARRTGPASLPFGLASDIAFGAGEAGTVFLSVGFARSFNLGAARLDLRTGPALYHSGLPDAKGAEALQFYSSAGVSTPVGAARLGLQAAHISNAGLNEASSNTDILSLTLSRGF